MRNGAGLRGVDAVTTNVYALLLETRVALMKDQGDKKTMDLLRSPGAARAASYRVRQEALGRRQRPMWLTDAEFEALKQLLVQMRAEKP